MNDNSGLILFIFAIAFLNVAGAVFSLRRVGAMGDDASNQGRGPLDFQGRPRIENIDHHRYGSPKFSFEVSSKAMGGLPSLAVLFIALMIYVSVSHLEKFQNLLSSIQAIIKY